MKVKNVDQSAWGKKYMVVTECDGAYWFYDAWNDGRKARQQAQEIGGRMFVTEDCVGD